MNTYVSDYVDAVLITSATYRLGTSLLIKSYIE